MCNIWLKKFILKIRTFFKRIRKDKIREYSAECAYYTILSFAPFIIFFITLVKYTIIDKEIILNFFEIIVPSSMHIFIQDIINEIYSKSINTISISLIIALYSASKGFYAICKALKNIYKITEENSNFIIRIEGFIYTLVFVMSLLIALILIVLGNRIYGFILKYFFSIGRVASILLKIRIIIAITVLFLAFLILYIFIQKHKESFETQIPGAIFSSVTWIIISFIFSKYIEIFKGFSNIYGSLSSIILIMMWIYTCMYTILLGAEINVFFKEYKKIKNTKNR